MPRTPPAANPTLRCSFAAERRGDPFPGTAAPARGVLLIEQPGPWGRQALVESRLDPAIGVAVSRRAVALELRVLLIRRPGREATSRRRRWALADCRPGHEATWWGEFDADSDLLELPLDGSAGASSHDPTYLVCTHGRHDACCAIRGRPLAAALSRLRPGAVWECSHVGGDRFAANLVVLPHGLYYGRVDEDTSYDVVDAHERGEVLPALLRGRTVFPPVAQAAQQHVREKLGERAVNALNPVGSTALGDGSWQVRLSHRPRDIVVTVRPTAHGEAARLTCQATHSAHPPYFEIGDLREH